MDAINITNAHNVALYIRQGRYDITLKSMSFSIDKIQTEQIYKTIER